MNIIRFRSVSMLALMILSGCNIGPTVPPAPTLPVSVTMNQPVITKMGETVDRQEKGGLTISVAPVSYQVSEAETTGEERLVRRSINREYQIGGPMMRETPIGTFEKTISSGLAVEPDRLAFVITINNQLPRVFRGQGIVVQFNVNNKLQAVDQSAYADLTQLIVPPRNQQQVTIYGPALSTIPDKANIGLFLYDVVTNADAAGNTTEKQNFEWFYSLGVTSVERTVPAPRTIREDRPIGPPVVTSKR